MKKLFTALLLTAASLVPATGALAQSVSCTTFFAGSSMPMTDCSTPSGSVSCTFFADTSTPMTDCSGSGLASRPVPPSVFIKAGAWGLGLGSALAEPRLIAERRFDELAERATAFLRIAAQAQRTT